MRLPPVCHERNLESINELLRIARVDSAAYYRTDTNKLSAWSWFMAATFVPAETLKIVETKDRSRVPETTAGPESRVRYQTVQPVLHPPVFSHI